MKKITIIRLTGLIILMVLIYGSYVIWQNSQKTATIRIMVVPTNSVIKINGVVSGQGIIKIRPGNYTISVFRSGFSTQTKQFDLVKGSNVFYGVILSSNTSSTSNYYLINTSEERMAESIVGYQNKYNAAQATLREPIIKLLPHYGPGLEYRVDYANNPADSTLPIIEITAPTPIARQDALNWIKSKGYDLTYLDIAFINQAPGY